MCYNVDMKEMIPAGIKRLFWDVNKERLDVVTDQKSIMERVLNYGTLSDWRWLVATYGTQRVREVLLGRGALQRTNIREQARQLFSMLTKGEK